MLLIKYYFNFYLLISLAVFHFIDVIVVLPILWTSQVVPVGKNLPASAGDTRDAVLISGSVRSPGEENGNLLQYFLPGKFHGQRNLTGYSPWGHKESDTTDHTHATPQIFIFFSILVYHRILNVVPCAVP